jgi:phage shock protein PspC (stress-responsive transcriptional regulator)
MAITFPISLKAVVIGKAVTAFIYFYMNAFMIGRLYGFGAFKQLFCCWKGIIATIAMYFGLFLIRSFLSISVFNLFFEIFCGIIIYIIVLIILKESELSILFGKLINKIKIRRQVNKE